MEEYTTGKGVKFRMPKTFEEVLGLEPRTLILYADSKKLRYLGEDDEKFWENLDAAVIIETDAQKGIITILRRHNKSPGEYCPIDKIALKKGAEDYIYPRIGVEKLWLQNFDLDDYDADYHLLNETLKQAGL